MTVIGVRVAGIPAANLEALGAGPAWAAVTERLRLAAAVEAGGRELADLLFPVIGRCADPGSRPGLVGLRRALFRAVAPGPRAWSPTVRAALPDDLRERVEHWLAHRDRLDAVTAALPDTLAADRAEAVRLLREAVAAPAFRSALVLGSPTLSAALDAWIDDPAAREPRPQVLVRAAKYLARAAAKTSPYASFTLSGLGGWTAAAVTTRTTDLAWRSVVELERQVVTWLWDLLARRPALRDRIGVRVNPGLAGTGETVRFLDATPGERVVEAGLTPAVRDVLDFLRTAPEPTAGQVPGLGPLLDLGLVRLRRPFADQDPDPLPALRDWLLANEAADPVAAGVAATLTDLHGALRAYPEQTDVRVRADLRDRAHRRLGEIFADLRAGQPAPALPARDLVWENAVVTHPVVTLSRPAWQPVLDDLRVLREFLGIFNPHLPARADAAAFFRRRYRAGTEVGFLDFYRDFHADRPPRADRSELVRLRREAVRAVYRDATDDADQVTADPALLAGIAGGWPAGIRAPWSIGCYGHELPGPGGPRFVLNRVHTGYGWGVSRIHHLIGRTGARPRELSPAYGEDLLECRASFGSNLSLRAQTVPYALHYPGEEGSTGQLSLADLTVAHDPEQAGLVLRARGGPALRPLPLGMLAEHRLPPALGFLIRVFGESQTAFLPDKQLGGAGWRDVAEGIRRRPRVTMGRVVLVRGAWSVPARLLRRVKGESDAGYLLRIAGLAQAYGLPRRSFVQVAGAAGPKARKPLYLDLANWLLLTSVERTLAGVADPGTVVEFEEALPTLADAPGYGGHGRRVTEYVIELTGSGTP